MLRKTALPSQQVPSVVFFRLDRLFQDMGSAVPPSFGQTSVQPLEVCAAQGDGMGELVDTFNLAIRGLITTPDALGGASQVDRSLNTSAVT
jgi:hypothetical protein